MLSISPSVSAFLMSFAMSFINESSTLHVEPKLITMFAEHQSLAMFAEHESFTVFAGNEHDVC